MRVTSLWVVTSQRGGHILTGDKGGKSLHIRCHVVGGGKEELAHQRGGTLGCLGGRVSGRWRIRGIGVTHQGGGGGKPCPVGCLVLIGSCAVIWMIFSFLASTCRTLSFLGSKSC